MTPCSGHYSVAADPKSAQMGAPRLRLLQLWCLLEGPVSKMVTNPNEITSAARAGNRRTDIPSTADAEGPSPILSAYLYGFSTFHGLSRCR